MSHLRSISRRRFLGYSSLLGVSAALGRPESLLARSPNDRIRVAFIGVGGRGEQNLAEVVASGEVEVTALCDVDGRYLATAGEAFPGAHQYRDFRRLYDDAQNFDAVVISAPEHVHAYATLPALQLGKHVYCEKPLTHNIQEARRVTEAAATASVATQMGTQIHSQPNYRRVVELIQSGAIGPVREVHAWVSRAWGLQSREDAERNQDRLYIAELPSEAQIPPPELDWDLWLGPAPERPYNDIYLPGPNWYRWWDFGSGTMSDLGSHWIDLPFWALELDAPRSVEAFGAPPHPHLAPATMKAVYEYGPRGERPACQLSWYQGDVKPELWTAGEIPQWGNGVLFVGEKGMLLSDYGKHLLLPEDRFAGFEPPTPWIPDSPGHHQEWLNACRNGSPTGSPFSYAGPLTEANHLGNIAYRLGKRIEWDAAGMRATNAPEAEALIARQAREGWRV